ncbi:MAG: c-type cytochrome biogenesis protein CcsB, partial [Polaromonas sp.]|nr:c-type cytochrome biogenesis protein CcsB [Polaromonas sp.]
MNNPGINTTTTLTAGRSSATLSMSEGYFAKRNVLDWVFAALVAGGFLYAFMRYSAYMDVYEKGILLSAIPATIAMGWFWRPLRVLMALVAGFALLGIASYQGDLARAEQVFWLKYFLSSQS